MLEGLPPHRPARVLRLTAGEGAARRVADLISESFEPAETAVAAFEDPDAPPAWEPGRADWHLEAYFAGEPDEAAVRDLVRLAGGEALAAAATFGAVEERDWVAASLEGLAPVRAGRFLVHGSHDRGARASHLIAIEVEAALAFGTGHHGTTRGCLLALDAALKRGRPGRVLDVGTGTGVLAIAAARALRRPVAAGDLDPVAVATARANARANGAGPLVRPVVAAGLARPALAAGAPYDLILANILARPLRRLAPSLAGALAPRGALVLSGLLGGDVPGVLAAYRAQGLALAARADLEGWATLRLARGGAAPRRAPRARTAGAAR